MIVVQDSKEISQNSAEALVITGDGKNETDRIKAVAPKFNCDRKLLFPYGTPGRSRQLDSIIGKRTPTDEDTRSGMSTFKSVETYESMGPMRTRLRLDPSRRYLIISDKEDMQPPFQEKIENKLNSIASTPESVEVNQFGEAAFDCRCDFPTGEAIIYCGFIGDETGCFEDGLAELLEIRRGLSINPNDRDELKGILRSELRDLTGKQLLVEAEKWEIQEAFPNLSACLMQFEND
jgi:hypothetical protein